MPRGNPYMGMEGEERDWKMSMARSLARVADGVTNGSAPVGAPYLTAALDGSLTDERVTTDTATISWDHATANQAKANVVDGSITNAKLRNSAALSVIGRSANSVGSPADIVSAQSGYVLQQYGTEIIFGPVTSGSFAGSDATDGFVNLFTLPVGEGDLIVGAGGLWTAFPIGAETEVLTVVSGTASWRPTVAGHNGSTTIDFGVFPGSTDTSVAVTGQTTIDASSIVRATMRLVATADHYADEHWIDEIDVYAGNIVAGTGFTIYAKARNNRLYGQYNVAWNWA